jgi:hypothetical protein
VVDDRALGPVVLADGPAPDRRTCTSRFWTSCRIIGDWQSSMMRWWKRRLATEYSLRCERTSPSSNVENSVRRRPDLLVGRALADEPRAIDSSAAQTVIISMISALLLRHDVDAAARQDAHEALVLEPRERLADRRAAHAELAARVFSSSRRSASEW